MVGNPEEVFGGTERLLSLIELVYSAVYNSALWPAVLEAIAEAAGGESTALFARFPTESLISLVRFEPGSWEQYTEYYSSINPIMARSDTMFRDGEVRYSQQVIADGELQKTEFYQDFFRRYGMHYSFGIKIPLGNLPAAFISCQRPQSKGPFEAQEGLVYQTLLPHLQRALTLHFQFEQMRSSMLGLETALDRMEQAVFGLSSSGKVIVSNRRAEAIAQAGDALCVREGSLHAVFREQNRQLQIAIAEAVATGSGAALSAHGSAHFSAGSSLLLHRRSDQSALRITVTPFLAPLSGIPAQLAALVFLSDPASIPQSRSATLRALFALTPTEARLADQLLQGLEIREAAHRLDITLETARFVVKRIFAKTGTNRQTELLRLMLSLPSDSHGARP